VKLLFASFAVVNPTAVLEIPLIEVPPLSGDGTSKLPNWSAELGEARS
jgi:hypothetical protein